MENYFNGMCEKSHIIYNAVFNTKSRRLSLQVFAEDWS